MTLNLNATQKMRHSSNREILFEYKEMVKFKKKSQRKINLKKSKREMNNSILTGLILMVIAMYATNAQFLNSEKRLEFSNWKSKNGKEYGDKVQESLR